MKLIPLRLFFGEYWFLRLLRLSSMYLDHIYFMIKLYSHCSLCSSHKISVQPTGIYFTRDLLRICSEPPNTQGSLLMEAGVWFMWLVAPSMPVTQSSIPLSEHSIIDWPFKLSTAYTLLIWSCDSSYHVYWGVLWLVAECHLSKLLRLFRTCVSFHSLLAYSIIILPF